MDVILPAVFLLFTIGYFVECSADVVVNVDEGSVNVLRCPFKSDKEQVITWFGPPNFKKYTIGTRIDPSLTFKDRLNVTGDTDNGEYHLQISDIQNRDEGQYRCSGISTGSSKNTIFDLIVTAARLVVNVDEGSVYNLRCPFKSDTGQVISWSGPPNLTKYTIGLRIDPSLTFGDRLNVTGDTDNGEYHLQISDIQSRDEGQYRCSGISNGWSKSEIFDLIVTAQPTSDPLLRQIPNGLVIDGTTISLTCTVIGGKPIANISWQCDRYFDPQDQSTTKVASSSIKLTVSKADNDKMCNCTAKHSLWYPAKTAYIHLNVGYPPDVNPIIKAPTGGIITGTIVTLTCTVSGGNPLVTLTWNCTGAKSNNTAGTTASYGVTFAVDKSYNSKVCTCSATHPVSSYRQSVQHTLVVYYTPEVTPIIQAQSGGILTGTSVTLTCTVSGGNPLVTLTWNCTGAKSNNTAGTTASYGVTFVVDKSYNNKVCTCSAFHPVSSYRPSVQHTLVVYYPPDFEPVIQQTPVGGIIAGNEISLTCTVSGGNPLVTLAWNCTGVQSNSTTGTTASYGVTFAVDKSYNNKVCTCSVTHPVSFYRSKLHHIIFVYYAPVADPVIRQKPTGGIISGNDITLTCTVSGGNPLVLLTWDCTGITTNNTAGTKASYGVTFTVDKTFNNKVCTCLATHLIASYRRSVQRTLLVYFKPVLDQTRPYSPANIDATKNKTLQITTTVTANPKPTIEWTFKSEADWSMCNVTAINANTTTDGIRSTTFISIDNIQNHNFGEYTLMIKNTAGTFYRRFVVMEEGFGHEMLTTINKNTGILIAGITTLAVGLLSLTAAVFLVVRNSFKKKDCTSDKSDEYTDIQRDNPAFTDAYTSLQSDIESRSPQEQTINTYDECGRTSVVHAYSSVDIQFEQSLAQHHGDITYEECGKRSEAHACDT